MKKIISLLACLTFIFLIVNVSSAQLLGEGATKLINDNSHELGASAGFGVATVGSIIATIIKACLGLLAAIFLTLMITAGFKWMTAGGNEEQVKKAQETIKTAIIGLIIVLAAYTITYFIFKYLPFSRAV